MKSDETASPGDDASAAEATAAPAPTLNLAQQETQLRERLVEILTLRKHALQTIAAKLQQTNKVLQQQFDDAQEKLAREKNNAFVANVQQRDDRTRRLASRQQNEHLALEKEYQQVTEKISNRYQHEKSVAKKELKEASWETQTVFDATKHRPKQEFIEAEKAVSARAERLEAIATAAKEHLQECQMYRAPQVDPNTPLPTEGDPLEKFQGALSTAEAQLTQLKSMLLPRLFRSGMPFWLLVLLWIGAAYPFGVQVDWHHSFLWKSGLTALGIDIVINLWLYLWARRQVARVYDPLCQLLLDAERARTRWMELATEKCQRETAAIMQKYKDDLRRAEEKYETRKSAIVARRTNDTNSAQDHYVPKLSDFQAFQTKESQDITKSFEQRQREVETEFKTREATLAKQFEDAQAAAQKGYQQSVTEIGEQWRSSLAGLDQRADEINAASELIFPPWNAEAWERWSPPKSIAPVLRFGQFEMPLFGSNEASRAASKIPSKVTLPAFMEFPDKCSLLIRASGAGRLKAVDTLQAVMLRFLTIVPPGKVRFTIIDPVGLGQNFAGFMHLADYDELLVTNKIWTEPSQIEQRLSDLSSHMANVIQKYLRNEFATIDDYNQYAGEVAEPYRVVVVANFPFNFTETATRHLVSIATTGARCGVYVLVSIDTKLTLPHGFRFSDLEQNCVKLAWRDGSFVWKDEAFEAWPLALDGPPAPELFSSIVHEVGEAAKHGNRVEVPFEFIAPEPAAWWTSTTASGLDVPLGRAGATKRQHMQLGRGTSQHVLVAGKTGSGKSTLMHALITNAALLYSPEELELYLIDFKKGVEFKTYAEFALPHARVIAIESEREFGLSVLQRLDVELKERGELFREHNVQDLPSYRENTGRSLPRILLVVDEFQEFFVEDDKIAQDVSLLLDRLVRQGRAFGIHVHLGSQTLGGAFSLPRATLGQMAVRIALQCSEADANLILSEENPAARLLTRPGEAIYNDANGRSEGNHLFQVVWLSEERRERYLRDMRQMAIDRQMSPRAQIVFEGNVPAELHRNLLLQNVIDHPAWPERTLSATTWLGEAIAIKDPTSLVFRAQSGNNTVIIGQQSEAALAIMMTMLAALASQHAPPIDEPALDGTVGARPRFIVADGQAPDSPLAGQFAKLAAIMPHGLELCTPRDIGPAIESVTAEIERRQSIREGDLPPIYFFVYDLQRFRDLRKSDDDFGFGRETKVSLAKQFVSLLKDGPALGVHAIVWSDSLNNLQRAFDRQAMREFESRVLFQMSVTDSSTLIDSQAASKLGPNRALLHSEEEGRLEKFRPYRLPDDAWLAQLATAWQKKSAKLNVPVAEK